jgi:MFS family permease
MNERLRLAGRQATFAWLNFALTAPSIYLWLGLPLLMRQQGWSGMEIGLFQLAGLPAVFKFLLARPMERSRVPGKRYTLWAVGLCLGLIAVLLLLGQQDLLDSQWLLFGLAFAVAWLTTWADIPVNALAIQCLPPTEHLRAGAWRSGALSLGAIVGGGVMLMIQLRWGWRAPFVLLALMLTIGVMLLVGMRVPAVADSGTHVKPYMASPLLQVPSSMVEDFKAYLDQPGARKWTVLLMTYFPFVGAAWFYLKPLLLDMGFEAQHVAQLAGVGGGVVACLSSLVAAGLARRLGLRRAVPIGAWLGLWALAGLSLAAAWRPPVGFTIAAATGVAIAMGYIAALAFALTMHFARRAAVAVDYGLQSSLFSFSRLLVPALIGILLDYIGLPGAISCLALAMSGVLVFCLRHAQFLPDTFAFR